MCRMPLKRMPHIDYFRKIRVDPNGAYLKALPNQYTAYATETRYSVVPAQAGIQRFLQASWIPACAGMTKSYGGCL